MKLLFAHFAIFALFLVIVNAGANVQSSNIEDVIVKVAQSAKKAADTIKTEVDKIVLDPLKQVEAELERIEALNKTNHACVAAEDERIGAAIDGMRNSMLGCGFIAARTTVELFISMSFPIQKMVTDGYALVNSYKQCESYQMPIMKKKCFERLHREASEYKENTRNNFNIVKNDTNERLLVPTESCTHVAAEAALKELKNIQVSIKKCIDGN